ncbi:hypothetical protein [Alloalcanivorax marinus]|uniref:hypothetical protein n=1 Tax=Alloalcanivorax marinus TaxID=1177169 RepID=UPI001933CCE0|nr:hypothetical protein [Alloalcanivorax marinus]MBL7252194.1 hypothetical protein [Alloalcanivorax marinus]
MIRIISAVLIVTSTSAWSASPPEDGPLSTPLDPDIVTNATIIGESRWSDEEGIILEREYYLKDGKNEIYAKRRFRVIENGRLELIWRSPEARNLDVRACAFYGGKPIEPGEASKIIYSDDVVYSVSCEISPIDKKTVQDQYRLKTLRWGGQYLRWQDANSTATAGINAVFLMRAAYRFHGAGQAWFNSSTEAARDPGSCVLSILRTHTGQGTHESILIDSRRAG